MVGALDFQPESRWFEPGLCCHVVALESPPRCIIGYRRHNAGGGGGGSNICDGLVSYPGGSSNTLSRFMLPKPG